MDPTVAAHHLELSEVVFVETSETAIGQIRSPRLFGEVYPFLMLLAAYCAWILSLPLFPSQDGPMHLYYVDVLRRLLSGDAVYKTFYALRTPFPPYTGQYLLLLLLEQLLSPVWAEKVGVCLILISTACGFRYMATALGRAGGLLSLFSIPLALSWPLMMGFHSFCLSLSFAFWSLGFWFRGDSQPSNVIRTAFLLSVAAVAFTHPVPLLFLLGIVSLQTVIKLGLREGVYRHRVINVLLAAVAISSLTYIALFVVKGESSAAANQIGHARGLQQFFSLRFLTFASGGWATKSLRFGLYTVLIGSLALAGQVLLNCKHQFRLPDSKSLTWILTAVGLLAAVPVLPSHMNGSDYFAERLLSCVWLSALAAASAHAVLPRGIRQILLGSAYVVGLGNLAIANDVIRPVANTVMTMETIPVQQGRAGLVFPAQDLLGPSRANFDPFREWSAARYFRRAHTLLLNDPWSVSPYILPVLRRDEANVSWLPKDKMLGPELLHSYLLQHQADRKRLLGMVDTIIFLGLPSPVGAPDPLLGLDPERTWHCQQYPWFFVCQPNTHPSELNSLTSASELNTAGESEQPFLSAAHYKPI